jgi:hypothetical protein
MYGSMILKKWTCVIKNYPTEIKVSEQRRAQYWYSSDDVPKKYKDTTKYSYSPEGILLDSLGERVVKNSKTAGKPRMMSINAQKIYVGIHHSVRSKIVKELHTLFHNAFEKQLPAKIDTTGKKIMIGLRFYDVYTSKLPDLDNLANLFVKCGIDCLTTADNPNQVKQGSYTHKLGIIPDDKLKFIPHIMYEFTNVNDEKDRKLEFSLYEVTEDFSIEKACQHFIDLNLQTYESNNSSIPDNRDNMGFN